MGVSKFQQLGLSRLWLRWGRKQSCSPCRELFNGMLHTTCTQGNHGDSWFLVVQSQIANLTLNLAFGYNLCFKYPNGSHEPISEIYISRSFQWYKERLNPMGFDPCNCFLEIWKSIGTPTPKVGAHLGVWSFIPSHSFALLGAWNVAPRFHTWPTPL
jgi:hypothetical protein